MRNPAIGVDLAGQRVADRDSQCGEIATPPGFERDRRVEIGRRRTAVDGFARHEPEGAAVAIVEPRNHRRAAEGQTGEMNDARRPPHRERVLHPEDRALVVIEHRTRKTVRAGLRDNRDLPETRRFGAVVRDIDLHFLEGLDVVGERADRGLVDPVAHRRAVDRELGLVQLAAGEGVGPAAERHHRRDRQGGVDAGVVERQRAQLIRGAHIADPRRLELDRRTAGGHLDGRLESPGLEDGVDAS